jgi:hypothetical protein
MDRVNDAWTGRRTRVHSGLAATWTFVQQCAADAWCIGCSEALELTADGQRG